MIESLEADFEPEELQSEYRRDLRAMLEAKLAGEEISRPEPVAEDAPVVDLMEALRKSVEEATKQKTGRGQGGGEEEDGGPPEGEGRRQKVRLSLLVALRHRP